MNEIKKDWVTESGLRAVILFVSDSHHCGYIEVPKNHPLFGKEYSESCDSLTEGGPPESVFDVHGGITYSGGGEDSSYPVESDGWWFGYDCAHAGDKKFSRFDSSGVFRDVNYCVNECESLAKQIAVINH